MTTQAVARGMAAPERYPLFMLSGLLVAALALIPALPGEVAASMLTQVFVALLLTLAFIDLVSLKVPNILIYPAIVFALSGTAFVDASVLDEAALGGVALLAVMFVLAILGRGAMGMGDVKFAALVGCALGWKVGLVSVAAGFVLGALISLPLLIFHLKDRKDVVPLTPFLGAAASVFVLLSGGLVT